MNQFCKESHSGLRNTVRRMEALVLLSLCAMLFSACAGVSIPEKDRIPGGSEVSEMLEALLDRGEAEDLYDVIFRGLSAYQTEIKITNHSSEEIKAAYLAVLSEHPELFWVANGYSSSGYTLGSASVITLEPLISDSLEVILEKKLALQEAMNSVLRQLPEQAGDYEKALFLHDWLVRNTAYDVDTYTLLTKYGHSTDYVVDSATAYGCLVEHRAVCSGYAGAYQLLLEAAGIQSGRVTGTGRGGEHEWNYVVLDGEAYYVDVTWDDPVTESDLFSCSHEYFCITSEELLRNHSIDSQQYVPRCTATEYNYYRHEGLFLEEYSFDAAAAAVEAQRGAEGIELAFSSPAELYRAKEELLDAQAVFEIPLVRESGGNLAYSLGSTERVLQLYLG